MQTKQEEENEKVSDEEDNKDSTPENINDSDGDDNDDSTEENGKSDAEDDEDGTEKLERTLIVRMMTTVLMRMESKEIVKTVRKMILVRTKGSSSTPLRGRG